MWELDQLRTLPQESFVAGTQTLEEVRLVQRTPETEEESHTGVDPRYPCRLIGMIGGAMGTIGPVEGRGQGRELAC